MHACAAVLALFLAACSEAAAPDPCAVAADGVSLSPKAPSEFEAADASLACTGTAGGSRLDCAGGAALEHRACTDGFAFVLSAGPTRLMLRLQSAGNWKAGARLADGPVLSGAATIGGLPNPATPVPESGRETALSASLQSDEAVFGAQLRVRW